MKMKKKTKNTANKKKSPGAKCNKFFLFFFLFFFDSV